MKKWLFSVAVDALLVAGNAAGITVHEALSNDFWASQSRYNVAELKATTQWKDKVKKDKYGRAKDGSRTNSYIHMEWGQDEEGTSWKTKLWNNSRYDYETFQQVNFKRKDTCRTKSYKERNLASGYENETQDNGCATARDGMDNVQYKVTPVGKDVRPMRPFVMDDWFPGSMRTSKYRKARFFGTEHNAVTNIISDNEAYITGTVSQTGHMDEYFEYKANADTFCLRTYTQHITTDENHVYVEQEIIENAQTTFDRTTTQQTQYVATFKKGRWKGSTETSSSVWQNEAMPWLREFYQNMR
ncbi:hypothetical protein IKW72_05200 [bacterium]|nr:hypothetical protein [bacterium]MBR5624382.1 hypothetical protein [bacterium]